MPYLEDAKRPIPVYRTAPRIPQAGDLSPGHLRHGHGEAIYLRGHTAPNRHIVRVVSQWTLTGYTDIPQNAKPDLSHLPHYAIEEGSEQSHRLGTGVRGRVVSEHALSGDPKLSSENFVINREILNKTRRRPCQMQSTRAMPAVPLRPRSDLYVPITCAKMRKASHCGSHSRVACLTPRHQHEFET